MIRLCSVSEIPEGEGLRVPGPVPLAVFVVDGEAFVLDDACSHQAASLSDGYLEGCWVECPLHEVAFSLRTGLPSGPPARKPVRTWPAVVADGVVYADLDVVVEVTAAAPAVPAEVA
ncbi:bifunctional 3-phenylpropionate/cinnamic acid dioxygenase ferredoxin subunit [Pseudonocardia alni]|uniref:bifunctional 3-phenylpropionate/cinnamic acid dioxygenase ferredoxin subunit n=1 Tax=Pseudonocardia alni TaxID=33907 RepID=UPI00332A78BC